MRILLISPTSISVYGTYSAAAKRAVRYPPLGLCYLAAAARAEGHEVIILDGSELSLDQIDQEASLQSPDLIGLTATLPTFHNAVQVAQQMRRRFPEATLVIGGPHVTLLPRESMTSAPCFDICVRGEAERTFPRLLRALENGDSPADIPGIMYRRPGTGELVDTGEPVWEKDLDVFVPPDRSLVDNRRYRLSVAGKGDEPVTTILASRGCPYHCVFCPETAYSGPSFRRRRVERVVDEMQVCVDQHDIHHFYFVDLTLTIDRRLILDLCAELRKRQLNVTWEGHTRVDRVDEPLLQAMRAAGLVRLSFGVESGSPEILAAIHKQVTLEQIEQAFTLAKRSGIETRASAILGHPFETRETAMQTLRFLRNLRDCDQLYLHLNVPYPGTALYHMAREGKGGLHLLTDDFSRYVQYGYSVLEVNDLSSDDLVTLQRKGLKMFYFTPSRVRYNLTRAGWRAGLLNSLAFLQSVVLG